MAPTEWVAIQVRHAGTFTRAPGGVFIGHRPPGTPVTPCININILI